MPLRDDPALLRGPAGFAARVNEAGKEDLKAFRRRIPGLISFAQTFIGVLLDQEFGTEVVGFPVEARAETAALSVRLKRVPGSEAARRLVMSMEDLCDLEIDRAETSGEEEDDDAEASLDRVLDLVDRMLRRFAQWVDAEKLPKLAAESRRVSQEFAAACARLKS